MKIRDVVLAVCENILKIAAIVAVVILIYRGSTIAYEYGYRIFEEPPMAASQEDAREVIVVIPEGMSSKEMGQLFYMKGLIRDEKLFQIQYLLSEFKEDLYPGEFTLSTAMTVEEMLKTMTVKPVEEETE